jgi:hypothetical protein
MALPTGTKELYRSRPVQTGRDEIAMLVVLEIPKAGVNSGADGWVGVGGTLPKDGDALSTVVTGNPVYSWTLFVEPTVEAIDVDPRYRVGFVLVKITLKGSRVWAN